MSQVLTSLLNLLRALPGATVAFSGGVDSAVLLAAARRALGGKVLAVTLYSSCHPAWERREASDLAAQLGVRHLEVESDVLADPAFLANDERRCYFCKKRMFAQLCDIARQSGLPTVVEGSNTDDLDDYRPGLQALEEAAARSPFIECGIDKATIRRLAQELDLPVWDKPASACLVSRLPYHEEITVARLQRIEKAEEFLRDLGFGALRARDHGPLLRLEVPPDDIPRLIHPELRDNLAQVLKNFGYTYITVDIQGLRTGSMNETLGPPEPAPPELDVEAVSVDDLLREDSTDEK